MSLPGEVAAVVRKEVAIHRQDPQVLMLMVVAPLLVIFLLTRAFGGASALDGPVGRVVLVAGADASVVKRVLGEPVAVLSHRDAVNRVERGDADMAVSEQADGTWEVIASPSQPLLASRAVVRLGALSVKLKSTDGSAYHQRASAYFQSLPGATLLFAFFGAAFMSLSFYREEYWGTWNRLLALPLRRSAIVAGKAIPVIGIVALQCSFLILAGALLLGLPIAQPLGVLASAVVVGATVAALGFAITGLTSSEVQAFQTANLLIVILAALGGAIVPLSVLPSGIRRVSFLSPHYWALDAFRRSLSGNLTLARVSVDFAVLILMATLLFGLGAVTMSWARKAGAE